MAVMMKNAGGRVFGFVNNIRKETAVNIQNTMEAVFPVRMLKYAL